jgi:hypothetical protein
MHRLPQTGPFHSLEWHFVFCAFNVLGLKLTNRFGDHWATVDAGKGLVIGLHPASAKFPAPGTKGGMMIGLEIDEPIEDPDGNPFYLWETKPAPETIGDPVHTSTQ